MEAPRGQDEKTAHKRNQPLKEEEAPRASGTAPGKQAGARADIFSYWAKPRPN